MRGGDREIATLGARGRGSRTGPTGRWDAGLAGKSMSRRGRLLTSLTSDVRLWTMTISLTPVPGREPAYRAVASQLRDLIISSAIGVGEKLPTEAEMASSFGVSRTTVREALRVLSSEGLLQTQRGSEGGTYVRRPNASQVSDLLGQGLTLLRDSVTVGELLEARELLEVPAAHLAAKRRDSAALEGLRIAAAISADELHDATDARQRVGHFGFHTAVLKASGNQIISVMGVPVFSALQRRLNREIAPVEFWRSVVTDHSRIAAAIEAGDADASEHLMLQHLENLREVYEAMDDQIE